MYTRFVPFILVFACPAVPVLAQVVTSEFFSLPSTEGWTPETPSCEPLTWIDDSWFIQDLDLDTCVPPKAIPVDPWTRSAAVFVGATSWFLEFRAMGTTDQTEITHVAPIALAAFNGFGISYHVTLASDQVRLLRDVTLPLVFIDLQPGIPHRIRVELHNDTPATYQWFVDSVPVDGGMAEGPFPASDARVSWLGSAWQQDALNFWDYIRFGTIPIDGSADFDSNGTVDSLEIFYFSECLDRSATGEPAFPSCSWADMNADNTVNCTDADLFAAIYTGPPGQLNFFQCNPPIPAVSQWGAAVLTLTLAAIGTVAFRRRAVDPHPN